MTYNTKRLFLFLFLFFVSFPARANYLGDFPEDATVNFMWTTNGSDGESITRSTDGSIWIWRDASTTSTVGITNTEDFNGMIGTHKCVIDLSADVFYATGSEYQVTIRGAVVDSKSVNAILRQFSIENRFMRGTDSAHLLRIMKQSVVPIVRSLPLITRQNAGPTVHYSPLITRWSAGPMTRRQLPHSPRMMANSTQLTLLSIRFFLIRRHSTYVSRPCALDISKNSTYPVLWRIATWHRRIRRTFRHWLWKLQRSQF